jgi:hypothetical protein
VLLLKTSQYFRVTPLTLLELLMFCVLPLWNLLIRQCAPFDVDIKSWGWLCPAKVGSRAFIRYTMRKSPSWTRLVMITT